jgi:hypothetical protein
MYRRSGSKGTITGLECVDASAFFFNEIDVSLLSFLVRLHFNVKLALYHRHFILKISKQT